MRTEFAPLIAVVADKCKFFEKSSPSRCEDARERFCTYGKDSNLKVESGQNVHVFIERFNATTPIHFQPWTFCFYSKRKYRQLQESIQADIDISR